MHLSIWIVLAALGMLIAWQIVRGVLAGKREQKRLDALFRRVMESQCPLCQTVYGSQVAIEISFEEEDQVPPHLAKVPRLNFWRIKCPHCPDIALLAENEIVFEILRPLAFKTEEPIQSGLT